VGDSASTVTVTDEFPTVMVEVGATPAVVLVKAFKYNFEEVVLDDEFDVLEELLDELVLLELEAVAYLPPWFLWAPLFIQLRSPLPADAN
jgi:hypothetical protein